MESLNQLIGDRVTKHCGKTETELLKFCQLQLVVVQEKSALMIRCPNIWTEKQLRERLLSGNFGQLLHGLGIERTVLAIGENCKLYWCWDLTSFSFKGYFINGDLTKLKIVNIPTIEELENMAGR
ncbi:hypothetical protein [Pleurocapsa sp. FMAR1]|uniref:hypothetical protein n=1 Tax=Pleurocapsa sp. FMAR1 TaxID=3040204 RepID=UPI0029C93A3F|nr:hypothetical protein [Pleurocapsa sp. FMAR1]